MHLLVLILSEVMTSQNSLPNCLFSEDTLLLRTHNMPLFPSEQIVNDHLR